MRTEARGLAALLLAGVVSHAAAEPPRWPTPEEMELIRLHRPFPEAREIEAQPVPRVPTLPQKPPRPELDIEGLARKGAEVREAARSETPKTTTLRLFVSLSLPEPTLQRLMDQAAASGVPLLLRGLHRNSMRQTAERIRALLGTRTTGVQIDPEAFDRFGITQVPSFVLAPASADESSCALTQTQCKTPEDYVRVSGDVSIDYALQHLLRARPHWGAALPPSLRTLQGTP